MQDSRANRKLIFNIPRKFVDNETGYLLGKPVNFISKNDHRQVVECIDHNTSHWEKEHNISLLKASEIFGEAYELNYIDSSGNFCAAILTPLNVYVLEDGTAAHTPFMALHLFEKPFEEDAQYLDVYTDHEILHYRLSVGEDFTFLGRHPYLFELVPVIVCPADAEQKSVFEDVVSLFDAYNALNSDLVNEIFDYRNAYLIIGNAKIEEDDLKVMKSMEIIQMPKGGNTSWLIKDVS